MPIKILESYLSSDKRHFRPAKELGKEGDSPWNDLVSRKIPMWKDYGYANYVSVERHEGVTCDTVVCTLPYNAQVTPYFKINASK